MLAPCYAKPGSYPVSIFSRFFATVRKGVQNLDKAPVYRYPLEAITPLLGRAVTGLIHALRQGGCALALNGNRSHRGWNNHIMITK